MQKQMISIHHYPFISGARGGGDIPFLGMLNPPLTIKSYSLSFFINYNDSAITHKDG